MAKSAHSSRRIEISITLCALLLFPTGAVGEKNALVDDRATSEMSLAARPVPDDGANDKDKVDKVLVFDNALLDRIFGSTRQESKPHNEDKTGDPSDPLPPQPMESALLQPNQAFIAKSGARVSAQQAAALRFAEQGRKYLSARDPERALRCFEKALSVGATEYLPYIYFYLAQTHFYLAHRETSDGFLSAAEVWLNDYPDWSISIISLREGNITAPSYTIHKIANDGASG
jgi:tetratricopeptide (TPR) repeat protein